MDPDLFGELNLSELSLTAKLSDFAADKFELDWPVHRVLSTLYAITK